MALSKRTDVSALGIYQLASGRSGTPDVPAQVVSGTASACAAAEALQRLARLFSGTFVLSLICRVLLTLGG
jgi:hypothetical protein